MRRVIGVGLCLLLVAACGSGGKSGATKTTVTPTTVESPEARPWVAAAMAGLLAPSTRPKGETTSDARCLATAFVNTVTVARFKAAGTKLTDLSNPNANIPPKLASLVPPATKVALGTAVQACGVFGRLVGSLFTDGLAQSISRGYRVGAAQQRCVAAWFDAPPQRLLIGYMFLNEQPSSTGGQTLARLFVDCLDVAAIMAPSMHLTLSDAERACIDTDARTDQGFVSALAKEIEGTTNGTNAGLALFGARTVRCLTPEHILQLARARKGVKSS